MDKIFFKKLTLGIIAILVLGVFLVLPQITFSQSTGNTGSYTLLTPLPIGSGGENVNSVPLGGDSFGKYLNDIFKIGIIVASLLAVIMIVIGGIQYMGGDSVFSKEDAKSKITNAIWGLILALGIYLLLFTINPDLVNLNLKIAEVPPTPSTLPEKATTIPDSVLREGLSGATADELETRRILLAPPRIVGINKDPCPVNTSWRDVPGGCTNVAGLSSSAIEKLKALKSGCNCNVVITGGTEPGHATHGKGLSVVDLNKNTEIDAYIKKVGTPTNYSGCSSGEKYVIDFTGGQIVGQKSVFTDEKIAGYTPHWHVCL